MNYIVSQLNLTNDILVFVTLNSCHLPRCNGIWSFLSAQLTIKTFKLMPFRSANLVMEEVPSSAQSHFEPPLDLQLIGQWFPLIVEPRVSLLQTFASWYNPPEKSITTSIRKCQFTYFGFVIIWTNMISHGKWFIILISN